MAAKVVNEREVLQQLATIKERIDKVMFRTLSFVGEKAVNKSRDTKSRPNNWTDQTGNLRSSIGYVVVNNGSVVKPSSFAQVGGGAEGAGNGLAYATSLASKHPQNWCLIVVAGMEYASYVESRRDVIDCAKVEAKAALEARLSKLSQRMDVELYDNYIKQIFS